MNKFNTFLKTLCFLVTALLIASCSPRNLVYFSDLPQNQNINATVTNKTEPVIQTGDLLGVRVSSLSVESNALFNAQASADPRQDGYLVDRTGAINFPVIGKFKVGGLSVSQATDRLTAELKRYVKDPIVNIRIQNFKVTVIGEVTRPTTFTTTDDKITILEALGMAGDITPFGKRENVLIIRERDGNRTLARLNLNNRDVLTSPYFYLQQNDIVYVEPHPSRASQASPNTRIIPVVTAVISAVAIIISRFAFNN